MEQLIAQLKEKAGLSQDQAEKASGVLADFVADNVSDDQVQAIAAKIPGIGQFLDKTPSNVGDSLGGFALNMMNRGE